MEFMFKEDYSIMYPEFKDKLEVFYPGVYSPEEQAALDSFLAGTYKSDMPGPMAEAGSSMDPVDDYNSKLYAKAIDKYNPLWFDKEYAQSFGWADTPVRAGFVSANAGMAQLPKELGDNANFVHDQVVGDAYDHEVEYFVPIYPGDTFEIRNRKNDFIDATDPNGSPIRALICITSAEAYNQRGELAMRVVNRFPSFRCRSKDPDFKPPFQHAFNRYVHPRPTYSDEDWEYMKKYMLGEELRKEPLYWEDVNIGDEPTPICEGPIMQCDMIRMTGWQIVTSNLRDQFESGKGHFGKDRNTGYYNNMSASHVYKEYSNFFNFTSRDLGVRLITNWCGPTGLVAKCAWRMINDVPPEEEQNHLPESYARPSWLFKVPYLKEAGKFMNRHGFTGDLGLMKGYVTDKYIQDGKHYVEIVAWAEDINGDIWSENLFTVILPSREDK